MELNAVCCENYIQRTLREMHRLQMLNVRAHPISDEAATQ